MPGWSWRSGVIHTMRASTRRRPRPAGVSAGIWPIASSAIRNHTWPAAGRARPSRNGYNCGPEWLSPPAERQRRYREHRAADVPVQERRPPRTLQAEYEAWLDQLPESLADSRTAELLEGVCDVDLDALDVELPRGFGRD